MFKWLESLLGLGATQETREYLQSRTIEHLHVEITRLAEENDDLITERNNALDLARYWEVRCHGFEGLYKLARSRTTPISDDELNAREDKVIDALKELRG